jgi:beta-glucanase (GH16 family)
LACGSSGATGAGSAGSSGAGAGGTSGAGGGSTGGTTGTGGVSSTGGGSGGTGGTGGRGGASGSSGGTGGASGGGGGAGGASGGGSGGGTPAGWTLTWSDEFDGAANASPDTTKWAYDTGGGGWGNNELEYYTNRTSNVATDGQGHLVITLRAESYMGSAYTSARIKTQGKFTQAYGRFEARIKIPGTQGVWPAFWMLGADIGTNPWPACGEIDIMENVGKEPTINHGSLHGPGYSGGNPLTGKYTLGSGKLSDDFHLYAVEWETNVIRFYVDDTLYETRTNADVPSGSKWVYDHPFFMILNIAIGGSFPGSPDSTTVLPQTMTVDYVRVYSR